MKRSSLSMPLNSSTTGNKNLAARDREVVWHPFTSLNASPAIPVVKAEGVWLHTDDGRKIMDAVSSWWVNLFGHGHPVVADAISRQAKQLEHVIFAGFTHEPAVSLAEKVLKLAGNDFRKVFFSDNGSTAVEVAIKLAIQYWFNQKKAKPRIVALDGAYHGDTFGAMSAAQRNLFNLPFQPYLFEVDFVPFPEAGKEDESIAVFEKYCSSGLAGVFIYEPLVQGTSGMRMYSPEVLQQMLEIARKHEIVCIADEVFTCMGRTGKNMASHYMGVQPDILCMSKGITGGFLPLGLTVSSDRIVQEFQTEDKLKTFYHGHSYTANPIACAAANASIDLLLDEEMQRNIVRISRKHSDFSQKIRNEPGIVRVDMLGTILAVELRVENPGYHASIRDFLYNYFLEHHILMRPLGNIIYLVPPYVISNEELDLIYDRIQSLLRVL